MTQARVIVIGNEKGGAGKSTIAFHVLASLLHAGARVGVIDLDLRQQSMGHFLASRRTWAASADAKLPMPTEYLLSDDPVKLAQTTATDPVEAVARLEGAMQAAHAANDFIIIDTPGGDTALSRAAHGQADQIVTPMNDSFVDFDLLGRVDPVTLDLKKPSIYAETVWEARKVKAATRGATIDWIVLRNRLASAEARNRRRVEDRMAALAKRVGFRIGAGLRDRVIYRELFPFGLTVADLSATVRPIPVAISHVAARQELRLLTQTLGLEPEPAAAAAPAEAEPVLAAS